MLLGACHVSSPCARTAPAAALWRAARASMRRAAEDDVVDLTRSDGADASPPGALRAARRAAAKLAWPTLLALWVAKKVAVLGVGAAYGWPRVYRHARARPSFATTAASAHVARRLIRSRAPPSAPHQTRAGAERADKRRAQRAA